MNTRFERMASVADGKQEKSRKRPRPEEGSEHLDAEESEDTSAKKGTTPLVTLTRVWDHPLCAALTGAPQQEFMLTRQCM
jgi:hypothetical protein